MRRDHRQWRIAKIRRFTCVPLSYANTRFAFIDAQRRDSVLLIRGISSYKTDGSRMIPAHSINICTRHKGRVINRGGRVFRDTPKLMAKTTKMLETGYRLLGVAFPLPTVIVPQNIFRVKFPCRQVGKTKIRIINYDISVVSSSVARRCSYLPSVSLRS